MRRIGKYELLDLLGRGGCGEVWKARDTELGRVVALKLMQRTDAEDLARFKREAHVVAQLSHPNIAQLYEFSVDPPYLAMQYIDGAPLAPTTPTKVAALRDAARAVHVAHERGILHRDLKPANIMVDTSGRASVLDFGLAREVKGDQTAMTVSGDILGTPSFMAPEQARGDVKNLNARTDVYGLGGTLYFLLTGRPPHTGATAIDVIRSVLDVEPSRPGGDREIETICLKALEKEPARRYATADDFADDLSRYLNKEPILARPASTLYRIKKRIQRQPVLWTLAAVLAAAILGGGAFGIWQLARVARERGDKLTALEHQRGAERAAAGVDRALTLLAQAEELTYSPDVSFEKLKPPAEALIRIADESLQAYPNDAKMWYYRGKGHLLLGEDDKAEAAFTRAIAFDPDDSRSYFERGMIYMERFHAMIEGFTLEEKTERRRRALATWVPKAKADFAKAQRASAEDQRKAAELWGLYAEGKYARALEAATERIRQGGRIEDFYIVRGMSLHELARTEEALKDFDEALHLRPGLWTAHFRRGSILAFSRPNEAIADFSAVIRINPSYEGAYNNRGTACMMAGQFDRAFADFDHAIELTPGSAELYYNRANASAAMGRYDRAFADYDRAIELKRDYSDVYYNRGNAHLACGDNDRAIADYDRAIEINKAYVKAYGNRGLAYERKGLRDRAIADYDRAIGIDKRYVRGYLNRGMARKSKGDYDGAKADFAAVLSLDPKNEEAFLQHALACSDRGDLDGAIADYDVLLKLNPSHAWARNNRGHARKCKGDVAGAIDDYTEALKADPKHETARFNRAIALEETGDHDGAIADYDALLKLDPKHVWAWNNRGYAKKAKGDVEGAIADFQKGLDVAPPDWPNRKQVEDVLQVLRKAGGDF